MGSVGGSWRPKWILMLFILVTSAYTVNGFFYDDSIAIDTDGYIIDKPTAKWNDTDLAVEETGSFWDVIYGIGDFLTFGNIENTYARIIINIFVVICWIIIAYLIYTFISQNIPFT